MNPDKKLLIKKNIENIIKNIRNLTLESTEKNKNIEIPKKVLVIKKLI